MEQILDTIKSFSTAHLEAIYNNSWKQKYLGNDVNNHRLIMTSIEFLCGLRNIEITGYEGSYELKVGRADNEHDAK